MAMVEGLPAADPAIDRQPGRETLHSWLRAYPPGVSWSAEIPAFPVWRLLDESVARHPERRCIDFLDRIYTYREIGRMVDRAAKGLREMGVGRGTRVGLFLPNCPYFVIFYFAVLKAGGIVVNFNPLYAERELLHQIEDSGTEILVTLDIAALHGKAAAALGRSTLRQVVVCRMQDALPFPRNWLFPLAMHRQLATIPADGRHVLFRRLVDNDGVIEPPEIAPAQDIAVLQYTGGTTGVPKGAMLTHANIHINAVQCARWLEVFATGTLRMLGVLPLFHSFAMTAVMNWGLLAGAELILLPRFELNGLLRAIHRKRPTGLAAVPTLLAAINASPRLGRYDLSSLRVCIAGGATLPLELRNAFEARTGCRVLEGYGLSECAPVVCCNPPDAARPGSVGLPYPGTIVEILSLDRPPRLLPAGEKGEICVRGPQVMAGYWRNPEASAEAIVDGRLHTGDIGFMDADGYVHVVDRLKEMINAGGYKVYPRVVEEAIQAHPAVAECAAVGVPDAYRGETVKAILVLKPGAALGEEELLRFLEDRLSPIEMPKAVEFRAALPKTAVGKIDKKVLRQEGAERPVA